jgi:hypothetical protein
MDKEQISESEKCAYEIIRHKARPILPQLALLRIVGSICATNKVY